MSRDRFARLIGFFLCAAALLPPAGALGDERKVVLSGEAKNEYNDNLFNTTGEKQDSFIATISPGIELVERTERLDAGLSAVLAGRYYSSVHGLNAVDQKYRGNLAYRVTPALRLSCDAAWRKDTSPDREIESSGLFVTFKSDRWNGSASAEYSLGERTTAFAAYGYEKADYRNQARADYETHSGSVGVTHDLGKYLPQTIGKVSLGFVTSDFPGVEVTNYTMSVGASRGVTETWSVHAYAGARHTRSEIDVQRLEFVPPATFLVVTSRERSRNWGWIADVSLAYKGDRNRGSLTFYHDVTVAAGRQGAAERNALVVDLWRQATMELGFGINGGYYTNKSAAGEFSAVAIDEQTVRFRPAVRYDFTKEIFGEASWQHTRVLYGQTDATAGQNVYLVRVAVRTTVFE